MSQRPTHVPRFGNWDANDHVPFTAVFENARAGKGGGKIINPNDPSENPAAFAGAGDRPPPQPPLRTEDGAPPVRPPTIPRRSPQQIDPEETGPLPRSRHERGASREEGEFRRPSMEPSAPTQQAGLPTRRPSGDSQGFRLQGENRHPSRPGSTGGPLRPTSTDGLRRGPSGGNGFRENGGTDNGVGENQGADQSPASYQAYQGRLGNKPGSASPAWERKASTEGGPMFAPATPGRSRLRPGSTRGDETPDRGPALPKFGAWNDKDPASGDGFTVIFNQARNEKKTGGPVRIPALQQDSPARTDYGEGNKQPQHPSHKYGSQKKQSSMWACCFQPSAVE